MDPVIEGSRKLAAASVTDALERLGGRRAGAV
jgi:hypothetical protein